MLADRWGGRPIGMFGMLLTIVPLVAGWAWGNSFVELLGFGCLLGIAGASFAVALPLASRWDVSVHRHPLPDRAVGDGR